MPWTTTRSRRSDCSRRRRTRRAYDPASRCRRRGATSRPRRAVRRPRRGVRGSLFVAASWRPSSAAIRRPSRSVVRSLGWISASRTGSVSRSLPGTTTRSLSRGTPASAICSASHSLATISTRHDRYARRSNGARNERTKPLASIPPSGWWSIPTTGAAMRPSHGAAAVAARLSSTTTSAVRVAGARNQAGPAATAHGNGKSGIETNVMSAPLSGARSARRRWKR